jgi:DNA polymerase III subunit delta'
VDFLQQAVDRQSLPHAMLFWGPEGTGKLSAAIALSQYLLCTDRQSGGSCGVCRSCIKTEKIIHPDVHFVFPIVTSKDVDRSTDYYPQWRQAVSENRHLNLNEWLQYLTSDNKQLNISTKECHRIIEQLSLKAYEASYKIVIMWRVEYLGKEGNKLLKLIEEPQDNTIIILIAEDRNAILPTILSRCQQFYFRPLPTQVVTNALETKLGLDSNRARRVAASSHGNWNLAQKIAAETNFQPVEWMQGWIRAAWSRDLANIKAWAGDMAKNTREKHKQYLRYTIDVWQKLFWIKWGIDFEVNKDEEEMLKWLNTKIEFNELEALVILSESNVRAIVRNANASILWMDATMQLRTALTTTHGQLRAQT